MHPVDAIDAGLATQPASVHDLMAAIPRGALTYVAHRDDSEARDQVERARAIILSNLHNTGATSIPGSTSWSIFWYREFLVLRGHLYGDKKTGRTDPTSPVLLANRASGVAVYGPEVPLLAAHVLGQSLVHDAWTERAPGELVGAMASGVPSSLSGVNARRSAEPGRSEASWWRRRRR